MRGDVSEGIARAQAAADFFAERGARLRVGGMALALGSIDLVAGDLVAAERDLTAGIEILQGLGETGVLSTLASMRADARYRLGRLVEMESDIRLARSTGAPTDIATQASWRWVAARAAADAGRIPEAKALIGEAIEMIEPTDFLEMRAETFESAAHVALRAGETDAWRASLERALAEHERKGSLVGAKRVRVLLANGPA
jgi:hypothetical protein